MSRVWLVIGMVLSLVVPVGFIAYSVANPAETSSQSPPVSTSQPPVLENPEDTAAAAAVKVVRSQLKELQRLNKVEDWRASHSSRARRAAAKLRRAARSLDSRQALQRVALKGAAFVVALERYFANPTQAGYERYDTSRKALNKAIRATQ